MVALSAAVVLATAVATQAKAAAANATNPQGSLAELPHWPVGMKLPESSTTGWRPAKRRFAHRAEVLVWAPPKARRIRAVLLIPNNTDSKHFGEHAALREVASRHELGVIYLRRFDGKVIERSDPPTQANQLQATLDAVAARTGIVEFRHAPWITFGKSSRGRFPFRTAWQFPERVIASISYHGETPTWPIAGWARLKDETILHVNVNGQVEWMGTWYRHVRPCLLNYRARRAWLPHQVVVHRVGHGNYADVHGSPGWGKPVPPGAISCLRIWDYLALFVDEAVQLRVPREVYPTAGPVQLKQVDADSGYLIHPRAVEELLGARWRPIRNADGAYQIVNHIKEPHEVYDENPGKVASKLLVRKATDVSEAERKKMFWVADRELALAWLKLHNVQKLPVQLRQARRE
jgi:hypothetical protein